MNYLTKISFKLPFVALVDRIYGDWNVIYN